MWFNSSYYTFSSLHPQQCCVSVWLWLGQLHASCVDLQTNADCSFVEYDFAQWVHACFFGQQCSLGKCWRSIEQEESGGSKGGSEEGRAWWEGGAPRQLSCEEANGLSSPSHVHRVFSDGHSSSETHIGLATGTELQTTSVQFQWANLASVWTLVSLYVTSKLAENESVTSI